MTRPSSTPAEPTATFADALSGVDGTADPVTAVALPPRFADPLAMTPVDWYREPPAEARQVVAGQAPAPQIAGRQVPPSAVPVPAPQMPVAPPPARVTPSAPMPGLWPPPPPRVSAPLRPSDSLRVSAPLRASASPRVPAPPRPSAAHPPRPAAASYPPQRVPQPPMRTQMHPPVRPARPAPANARKTSGGWVVGLIVLLFLIISGAGRQLLDALTDLLNR